MKLLSKATALILTFSMLFVSLFAFSGCSSDSDYTPPLKDATISTPAIGQAGVLRVGVNTDKSPLAGMGNEKIIGIDVDIAAAIADELGLELEIVDVGSATQTSLADNKVDIVMGIDNSETISDVWLSSEYLPTGIALFAMADSNYGVPDSQGSFKIAAQASSKSAWAVTNEFGDDVLSSTSDLSTAFDQLQSDTVQYVASDAVIGMYASNRQGVDVKIVALMDAPSGYCVGTKEDNTELQQAITSSLNTIESNGVIDVIERKWLGTVLELADVPRTEGKPQTSDANEGDEGDSEQDN